VRCRWGKNPAIWAEGDHSFRRTRIRVRRQRSRGPPRGIFIGSSAARHMLRHADHGGAAGRPRRIVQPSRVRCRASSAHGRLAFARWTRRQSRRSRAQSARRMDEPWRPCRGSTAGIQDHRVERQRTACGDCRRVATILWTAVSSGSDAYAAGRRDIETLRPRDRRLWNQLGDRQYHRGQRCAHPCASRRRQSTARAIGRGGFLRHYYIAPSARSSPACSSITASCALARAIK
jgi:hypothetical protein